MQVEMQQVYYNIFNIYKSCLSEWDNEFITYPIKGYFIFILKF